MFILIFYSFSFYCLFVEIPKVESIFFQLFTINYIKKKVYLYIIFFLFWFL